MKTLMNLKTWRLIVVPEPCHEVDLIFERIVDKTWVIFCVKGKVEIKNWDKEKSIYNIPFSTEELDAIQNTNKIYQGNELNLQKLKIFSQPHYGLCKYIHECKCSACGNNFCSGFIKCKNCIKNNYNHKTNKCKSYVEYNRGNHKCPKESQRKIK